MIVNYTAEGWEVITQRAHGMLAAQVGFYWKKEERPERWIETLLAIAEHDDAEVELEREELLTETGGPLDFSMKKFDLAHCNKVSLLTRTKSRYIALLTSMHMQFLYSKEASQNPQAAHFLEEQEKLRAAWMRELGIQAGEAKKIYALLEWCDAFSLIICQRKLQPEKRALEISTGPDNTLYNLYQLSEKSISVDPWPFEDDRFIVRYESRLISQLQFRNAQQFRKAFLDTTPQQHSWEVQRMHGRIKPPPKL